MSQSKRFCLRGHDTWVRGRAKHGECLVCKQLLTLVSKETCPQCLKEFVGRKGQVSCSAACARKIDGLKARKRYCIYGHDTLARGGRNRYGNCKQCAIESAKNQMIRYPEKWKAWRKKSNKKYAAEHHSERMNDQYRRRIRARRESKILRIKELEEELKGLLK